MNKYHTACEINDAYSGLVPPVQRVKLPLGGLQVENQKAVPSSLAALDRTIEETGSLLNILCEKLGPVTRSEPMAPEKELGGAYIVPLAGSIGDLITRVRVIRTRIEALLNTLEL